MMSVRSLLGALAVFLAATLSILLMMTPVADAQAQVTGAADFRNAPQLPPGQYGDTIVSGDSAWYSIVYTNGTPYAFEVEIRGDAPRELDLTVSFIAPTLDTVDGPAAVLQGSGASYPDGHTNVWFLKVSLDTNGQTGIAYPFTIQVDGVQFFGTEPCAETPECTLDAQYREISTELAQARSQLDDSLQTTEAVQSEIDNSLGILSSAEKLKPQLVSRLARSKTIMAKLCAPEPICQTFPDPGNKTPLIGWIAGLAAIGLGGARALKRFKTAEDPEQDDSGQDGEKASSLSSDRFARR